MAVNLKVGIRWVNVKFVKVGGKNFLIYQVKIVTLCLLLIFSIIYNYFQVLKKEKKRQRQDSEGESSADERHDEVDGEVSFKKRSVIAHRTCRVRPVLTNTCIQRLPVLSNLS